MKRDLNESINNQMKIIDSGEWSELDFGFIHELLSEMSGSDKSAIRSQVRRIILHLLKLDYQPEKKSKSWVLSIIDGRNQIEDTLDDSPSLVNFIPTVVEHGYQKAKKSFEVETGLSAKILPDECPYSVDDIMNKEIWK